MNGLRGTAVGLSLGALLCGCSVFSPRPDPSRFFTLTPIADPPAATGVLAGRVLGIGPITFPPYLDRPEIVIRLGPNEVSSARSDYWAGSLANQFETTLSQNLQSLLGPSAVEISPWYAGAEPDVALEVDVLQFEAAADGQAHLRARWRLRKGASRGAQRAAETNLAHAAAQDPGSAVAALGDLLGQFSREIADAVRALPSG